MKIYVQSIYSVNNFKWQLNRKKKY